MFSPRSPDNGTPMRLVSPELSPVEDTQSPPSPGYRTPVPLALGVGPDVHQERFIVALPPLGTVQHGDGTVNGPTVADLCRLLATKGYPKVREAAALALQKFGEAARTALPALEKASKDHGTALHEAQHQIISSSIFKPGGHEACDKLVAVYGRDPFLRGRTSD